MKLLKNQKAFLKTIKNEKARAEQKTQFKLQNNFESKQFQLSITTQISQEEFDEKLDEIGWIKCDTLKGTMWHEPINFEKRWKEKCLEMDKIIDESELKEKTKEESKSDFDTMQWGDRKEPENPTKETWYENQCKTAEEKFKETDKMIQDHLEKIWLDKHSLKSKTLTKEALRDLTKPKTKKTIIPKDNDYFLGTNFQDDIEFHKKALELSLKAYKDVVLKRDSIIAERNGIIQVPSDLRQIPLTPDECIKPTETVEPKTYTKGDMKKCFWNSRNLLNDVRETIWEYQNFEQYLKSLK